MDFEAHSNVLMLERSHHHVLATRMNSHIPPSLLPLNMSILVSSIMKKYTWAFCFVSDFTDKRKVTLFDKKITLLNIALKRMYIRRTPVGIDNSMKSFRILSCVNE